MIKDKPQAVRFPRLGKIKVGIKSDKGYPQSVDYFVPTGNYAEEVNKLYGEKPTKIKVVFPFDDVEKNMNEFYRQYKSSGLFRICDGFNCNKASDEGEFHEVPCEKESGCECNASMNLQFIIMGLPVVGVWAFDSASYYSRMNVRSSLQMTIALGGKLQGVPFWMTVEMQESSGSGNKNRFPVISLAPAVTAEDMIQIKASSPLPELPEPENEQAASVDPEDSQGEDFEESLEAEEKVPEKDPSPKPDAVAKAKEDLKVIEKKKSDKTTEKVEPKSGINKKLAEMSVADIISTIEDKMAPVIGDDYRHYKVEKLGFRELFELDKPELEKFATGVYDDLYVSATKPK